SIGGKTTMMPAWYERMNPRERVLSWIIAGAIFVLLNLLILSWMFGALGRAHAELAARKSALAEQALYIKERDLWTKRDEWIRKQQPNAFVVFENVNFAIDGSDPTMMRGKFKIARWFASAQRAK